MTHITLEQAVDSGRVFVLNRSKPKGDILITFVQPGSGTNFVAKVPKTWIPIAISDTVPIKVIADSVDFRSYLISKMLQLVPRAEAESILDKKEAQEERERIYSHKHIDEDVDEDAENFQNKQEKVRNDVESYIKDENLLVKDILERNIDNKASVTLNELRAIEDELTNSSLEYVIKNTEGKVRSWAERKLGVAAVLKKEKI